MCVIVCVRALMCVFVCVCVRAHASVYVCTCVKLIVKWCMSVVKGEG